MVNQEFAGKSARQHVKDILATAKQNGKKPEFVLGQWKRMATHNRLTQRTIDAVEQGVRNAN